jgi:Cu-Zn family superoxide dismutase
MATAAVAVLTGAAGVWAVGAGGAGAGAWEAEAALHDAWGNRLGTVSFEGEEGRTAVRLKLKSVGNVPAALAATNAYHGFHIHANNTGDQNGCLADPSAPSNTWFTAVDGHWKKDPGSNHSAHSGDMPSVLVLPDGTAELRFHTERFDPSELEGRAVILHAGRDNFGNVPVGTEANQYSPVSTDPVTGAVAATNNTGNAGDRIACGVIELD